MHSRKTTPSGQKSKKTPLSRAATDDTCAEGVGALLLNSSNPGLAPADRGQRAFMRAGDYLENYSFTRYIR